MHHIDVALVGQVQTDASTRWMMMAVASYSATADEVAVVPFRPSVSL
ncbi:MAG: hypothetical protein ABI866_07780 [Dokdonella sp.]